MKLVKPDLQQVIGPYQVLFTLIVITMSANAMRVKPGGWQLAR